MAHNLADPLQTAVRNFQTSLTPTQETELLAHSRNKLDATTILAFTAEIDKANANRRSRCVSSRLFGILQSVQEFSSIADTFVSAHPEIAALLWGSVKFTILAVNNTVSFFDKLSETFLKLSTCCPRYSEYQHLFADSLRLQKALCAFYAAVVDLCTKAIHALEKPGKTLAQSLWRPFEKEFGTFEDDIKRLSTDVREEIKLAGEQAAARERKAAATDRSSGSLFRTEIRQITEQERERRLQRDRQRAIAAKTKLLDRLSTYDYIGSLKRTRRKRYGTTGSWLSGTKAFKDWLEDSKSGTMWLSGIVGSGKSVATAAAIDDLLRLPRKSAEHIAFIFCEYDCVDSLAATTILGCLIRQCLSAETLAKNIEDQLKNLFDGTSPYAEDFQAVLQSVAASSSSITFIIDGLDECSQADKIAVLSVLSRVMSASRSLVKLFLSSREGLVEDVGRVFKTYQTVTMHCEEAYTDITTYVEDIVNEKIQSSELAIGSIQLVQEVKDALIQGANGMFLWVALQVDDLCRQRCDADIRRSIATLPKGLTETYQRIMSRVIQDSQAEIANKIFRWVAAAKRPLLQEELREAITIQPSDKFLERDRLVNDMGGLISWCGNLVTLDEEDLLVQFAHHTVKQFLVSEEHTKATRRFHFRLADIDHAAGEACVAYLGFNDFKRQMIKTPKIYQSIKPKDLITNAGSQSHLASYGIWLTQRFYKWSDVDFDVVKQLDHMSGKDSLFSLDGLHMQYSFLCYAREYWLLHTSGFTRGNTSLWNLWKQFVLTEHPLATKPWTIAKDGLAKGLITKYILDRNHASLLACFLESGNQVQSCIDQGYLLVKASGRGMTQLVESIVDYNNYQAIDGNKALQAAAGGGHLEVVERLLTAKADVNAALSYTSGRTALQAAAGGGHLEVVERLLTAKADVNAAPAKYYGRTALQAAAEGGHLEVVERLLTAKAGVNTAPAKWNGRTALQAAAEGGHLEVVERLLAARADVNAAPAEYYGRTALQAAAGGGHLEVVERLLTAKTDVNAAPAKYYGRTALQAAAEGGHVEVVEPLLTARADVNAAPAEYYGRAALQAAAGGGHVEVVEKLLAAKADVNAASAIELGHTALQAAVEGGHIEVAERLRIAGARD